MTMKEPKVEFENLDIKEKVVAASGTGGGERCIGTGEETVNCSSFETAGVWS